jgi:hypothetical protein
MGGWRRLHNEELHNLYSSPSVIRMIKSRRMKWTGHIACMGEKRNACRILVGKPEGKRPLGRHRHRWEDYIEMDLRFWLVHLLYKPGYVPVHILSYIGGLHDLKDVFWIWWSNLLDLYTTCYNISEIAIFDGTHSTSDCKLNWTEPFFILGFSLYSPSNGRLLLYALPSNRLFTKNLSLREGVYRAVA